jgi:hypothetical protein
VRRDSCVGWQERQSLVSGDFYPDMSRAMVAVVATPCPENMWRHRKFKPRVLLKSRMPTLEPWIVTQETSVQRQSPTTHLPQSHANLNQSKTIRSASPCGSKACNARKSNTYHACVSSRLGHSRGTGPTAEFRNVIMNESWPLRPAFGGVRTAELPNLIP